MVAEKADGLEQERMDALGGKSIERLLDSGTGSATRAAVRLASSAYGSGAGEPAGVSALRVWMVRQGTLWAVKSTGTA